MFSYSRFNSLTLPVNFLTFMIISINNRKQKSNMILTLDNKSLLIISVEARGSSWKSCKKLAIVHTCDAFISLTRTHIAYNINSSRTRARMEDKLMKDDLHKHENK